MYGLALYGRMNVVAMCRPPFQAEKRLSVAFLVA